MKLTGTEINKAYSEQLAKLLLDGYRLVVARENGSLEKNKDDFAKVVLEKDDKSYEYGFWYDTINQSTGKHTLTLTENDKYSWWRLREGVNNLLSEPYAYYSYTFGQGGGYEPKKKPLNCTRNANNVQSIIDGKINILSTPLRLRKPTTKASKKTLRLNRYHIAIDLLIKMGAQRTLAKVQVACQFTKI